MQITLAQALKEKNRLAGEISKLWGLIHHENSCWETHQRSIDVHETMETIEYYTAKLIELKTKIGVANAGLLADMYALEEAMNRISKLGSLDTEEGVRYRGINDSIKELMTAEITAKDVIRLVNETQIECNRLQDALDAYNATHKIDFETPLK